jgi:hypothetical protein
MKALPLTFRKANLLIALWHRHHKPVQGYRFAIACTVDDKVVGCAMVGRPVSRELDPEKVAEVTRLVTDGTKNACSFLYASCARAAQAMGFEKIQTYILEDEPGVTLKAAGWTFEGMTAGGDWNNSKQYAGKRRTDQPQGRKQRWSKSFVHTGATSSTGS